VLLSAAPEVDRNNPAGSGFRAYDVTTGFGITGSGTYGIEERGDADLNYQNITGGLAGEQLVVVFTDVAHRQTRHVSYQPTFINGTTTPASFDVTGLPTCGGAPTNAVISFSEMFECSDEQNGRLDFKPGGSALFSTLTTVLGGSRRRRARPDRGVRGPGLELAHHRGVLRVRRQRRAGRGRRRQPNRGARRRHRRKQPAVR
jgi:hypothetical protein